MNKSSVDVGEQAAAWADVPFEEETGLALLGNRGLVAANRSIGANVNVTFKYPITGTHIHARRLLA